METSSTGRTCGQGCERKPDPRGLDDRVERDRSGRHHGHRHRGAADAQRRVGLSNKKPQVPPLRCARRSGILHEDCHHVRADLAHRVVIGVPPSAFERITIRVCNPVESRRDGFSNGTSGARRHIKIPLLVYEAEGLAVSLPPDQAPTVLPSTSKSSRFFNGSASTRM